MKRLIALATFLALSSICLTVGLSLQRVSALSGSEFQASRIIDDGVFFNPNTVDAAGIQAFLNSKVPNCDTNGSQPYGGTTRAAYAASRGYSAPFTCLKDYSQNTSTRPSETALCNTYSGGYKSASQIIYDVGKACGVNPKVLIVLLEKEQSLVTDDWPWSIQYNSATGFGCPDTAPCDAQYGAFFDQVYYAARQFKKYARDDSLFRYRSGRVNYIQYNPNAGCGGTNVFIENQATAGLYNYTPYQPNASALANLYGTGDGCGAYGNRNFWRLYRDWFGPTLSGNDRLDQLNFIRLNHVSGKAELVATPSIGLYSYISKNVLTAYPAVSADGNVVPVLWPNGDAVFIRKNHASGKTELVSYSAAWNYQAIANYRLVPYPATPNDNGVIPMFWPNGDLVFIRLNHASGKTELVSYSASSGFQQMVNYQLLPYPATTPDGSVIPMFWPNGDLVFIRLNHASGKTELVSYSAAWNYQAIANYRLVPYPATAPNGSVIPVFKLDGGLSFLRMNHASGKTESITYSAESGFQQLVDYRLTAYPSVTPDGAVVPRVGP